MHDPLRRAVIMNRSSCDQWRGALITCANAARLEPSTIIASRSSSHRLSMIIANADSSSLDACSSMHHRVSDHRNDGRGDLPRATIPCTLHSGSSRRALPTMPHEQDSICPRASQHSQCRFSRPASWMDGVAHPGRCTMDCVRSGVSPTVPSPPPNCRTIPPRCESCTPGPDRGFGSTPSPGAYSWGVAVGRCCASRRGAVRAVWAGWGRAAGHQRVLSPV
jgi:hypothetical protein